MYLNKKYLQLFIISAIMLCVSIPFKETDLTKNESINENFQSFIAQWWSVELFAILSVVGNTAFGIPDSERGRFQGNPCQL